MSLPLIGSGSHPQVNLVSTEAYHPSVVPSAATLKSMWEQAMHWSQFGAFQLLDQSYSIRPDNFSGGEIVPLAPSGNEPLVYIETSSWVDVGRARRRIPHGFNRVNGVLTCKVPTAGNNTTLFVRTVLSSALGTDTGPTVSYGVTPVTEDKETVDTLVGRKSIRGVHDQVYLNPFRGTLNARCSVDIINVATGTDDLSGSAPEIIIQAYATSLDAGTTGSVAASRLIPINARAWAVIDYTSGSVATVGDPSIASIANSASVHFKGPETSSGSLSGTYEHIVVSPSSSMTLAASGSWTFWTRHTNITHNATLLDSNVIRIEWGYDASNPIQPHQKVRVLMNPGGATCNASGGPNACEGYSDFSIPDPPPWYPTQWRFWSVVYDGTQGVASDRCKLYMDGKQATLILSGVTMPTGTINSIPTYYVGASSVGTNPYAGDMDELCFWRKPLSQQEVRDLYLSGSPADTTTLESLTGSLIECFRMGDDDGTFYEFPLTRGVIQGITGTYTNMTSSAYLSADYPNPIFRHVDLNGSNQWIEMEEAGGTADKMGLSNSGSWSIWVRPFETISSLTSSIFSRWGVAPSSQFMRMDWSFDAGLASFDVTIMSGTWEVDHMSSFSRAMRRFRFPVEPTGGEWIHLAATFCTGSVSAYADGRPMTSWLTSGTFGQSFVTQAFNSTQQYQVGSGSTYDSDTVFFSGSVDDVMFWKRNLSALQVEQVYSSSRPCRPLEVLWGRISPFAIGLIDWYRAGDENDRDLMFDNSDTMSAGRGWYKQNSGTLAVTHFNLSRESLIDD